MNDLNKRLFIDIAKLTVIAMIMGGFVFIGFMLYIIFSEDKSIEETRLKEFSGIIIEKYRIRYEHNSPVIKIRSANKEDTMIYLNHFNASVFENLQIGDSVSTNSGDTTVLINRKGSSFIIYKTEYPAP